jgi:hypothetical protein
LALIGGAQAETFKANGEASGGDKLTACGQLIVLFSGRGFLRSAVKGLLALIFM